MRATDIIMAVTATAAAIQLVPYGRNHSNPDVVREPAWDHSVTRAVTARACFDCHSNETSWPWYSSIAPFSWLVQHHVDEGRAALNFSEWDQQYEVGLDSVDAVRDWEMPIAIYTWLHPAALLRDGERERLARGLDWTFAAEHARLEEGR
jgi:hypothetical protein